MKTKLPGLVEELQFTAKEFDDLGPRTSEPGSLLTDYFSIATTSSKIGTKYYVSFSVNVQRCRSAAEAQTTMERQLKVWVAGTRYTLTPVYNVGDACATIIQNSTYSTALPDGTTPVLARAFMVRNNVLVELSASGNVTPQTPGLPKTWDMVPLMQRMDKRIVSWLSTTGKPPSGSSIVPVTTPTGPAKPLPAPILPSLKGSEPTIRVGTSEFVTYRTVPPMPAGFAVGKSVAGEFDILRIGSGGEGNFVLWGQRGNLLSCYLSDVTGDGKDELVVFSGKVMVPETLRRTMRPITIVDTDGRPMEPAQAAQDTLVFPLSVTYRSLLFQNLSGVELLFNPTKERGSLKDFAVWADLYGSGIPVLCWVKAITNETAPDPKIPGSPCWITQYSAWDDDKKAFETVNCNIPVPGYKGTFNPALLRGLARSRPSPAPTGTDAATPTNGWTKSGLSWGAPTDTTGATTPTSP
jgi:hypothetical protein